VETADYLDTITRESAALADAAARAGLAAPVPTCPDWTVADLVAHIGNVQQWARLTVETRATERISWRSLPPVPGADALLDWFREQGAALVAVLGATDPDAPAWSWTDDHHARFWSRRQAHEVAVHRIDAESAAGDMAPIDPTLAVDGVDEWLWMLPFRLAGEIDGSGETVHLHCTDTLPELAGEWLVTLDGANVRVERVHAKGDVAARGTGSDLDLYLWGRVPASTLEVFGDAALLRRLRGLVRP
jgi:uncharacterized protein (TIGR03083 family)